MKKAEKILDKMQEEKIKRLGVEEIKLRQEVNSMLLCNLIAVILFLPLLFIFPPTAIAYVCIGINSIKKYRNYRKKSKFNVLGEKKRGR